MSAAVRFLAVAVAGWVLLRGIAPAMLPESMPFAMAKAEPRTTVPAIVPTRFPSLEPTEAQLAYAAGYPAYGGYAPPYAAAYPVPPVRYAAVPIYYPAPSSMPAAPAGFAAPPADYGLMPEPRSVDYSSLPELDEWRMAGISSALPDLTQGSSGPAPVPQFVESGKLDRLQLTAWALLRGNPTASTSLASGGTLGGSQAGARLTYNVDRRLAATLRSSSPVGGSRGGEVAAGVKLTPFPSIPVSLTAERRQSVGRYSTGRNAFALFLEGGLYQQPIGWNLLLDGYAQAGVVGARSRDLFADGGFTLMRPLYGRVSVGAGAWGGYQPGVYRIDAGPRVSMRVRRNMRVDLDWRQRLAGSAEPRSGPAVTLAADF